jgi:polysaccharide biosynthesis protein PslH
MRNLALLQALCQMSQVSLLIVADDVANETEAAQAVRGQVATMQVVPATRASFKRFYQLAGLLLNRPGSVWRASSPALGRALRQLLADGAFDAVYFEGIAVTGRIPPAAPCLIIDEHNLEWELLERSAQQAGSALRRLHDQRESAALRRTELATLSRADLVTVTSERERAALETLLPGRRICVVPNGVDVAQFAPGSPQDELPGRVVFTGSMDYYPNEQAALFFAEQCWPLIRRARPDASWYVVGANPPASVRRLADAPGVSVTGSVPETRSYLAQAQVAIAPLLVGGGTRLKILEALAMGKAMVSTSLGYEGLHLIPDEHLLIADAPALFAQAVIRALDDDALRRRLGAAGRVAVVRQYSWEHSGQTLRQAVASLDLLAARQATVEG